MRSPRLPGVTVVPRRHPQRMARVRRHRPATRRRPASPTPTASSSTSPTTSSRRTACSTAPGSRPAWRTRPSVNAGDFVGCPNQYWNGGPLPSKIAQLLGEWTGVALDRFGVWSDDIRRPGAEHVRASTCATTTCSASVEATTHFVVDTSRNGQRPVAAAGAYPDPQDWCNPPDRALGDSPTLRPATCSSTPTCGSRSPVSPTASAPVASVRQAPRVDPEWGQVDPGAGDWFPRHGARSSPPTPTSGEVSAMPLPRFARRVQPPVHEQGEPGTSPGGCRGSAS